MDRASLLACIRESLLAVTHPRLYATERGFQGELLVQLSNRLKLDPPALWEQEHQKTLADHGLQIRPDLVLHEPFDPRRHSSRAQGNLAVLELKRNASAKRAMKDFGSLRGMLDVLHYPLGVFVNINSGLTFVDVVPEDLKGRIVCFGVALREGKVHVVESAA